MKLFKLVGILSLGLIFIFSLVPAIALVFEGDNGGIILFLFVFALFLLVYLIFTFLDYKVDEKIRIISWAISINIVAGIFYLFAVGSFLYQMYVAKNGEFLGLQLIVGLFVDFPIIIISFILFMIGRRQYK